MYNKSRSFIAKPRCIYTGEELQDTSEEMKPSHEHIIPLSLGGSNKFTTDDVSVRANNRAGKEIDDAVASQLPFLIFRHKYKLRGNRRVIPDIKLRGEFQEIEAKACMYIQENGDVSFRFEDEQKREGNVIMLQSTEERVRTFLAGYLTKAKKHDRCLATPLGNINDEEDIDVALTLADRVDGKQFRGAITVKLQDYHFAIGRLMVKIAIGLGHKVLGPEWTFSPGGHRLRRDLFRTPRDRSAQTIRGRIVDDLPEEQKKIFRIVPHHHIMMVAPAGKKTVAIIALFGGESGTAIVDLGYDSRRFFKYATTGNSKVKCAFAIPLNSIAGRPLLGYSFTEMANGAAVQGLLPATRYEAALRGQKWH